MSGQSIVISPGRQNGSVVTWLRDALHRLGATVISAPDGDRLIVESCARRSSAHHFRWDVRRPSGPRRDGDLAVIPIRGNRLATHFSLSVSPQNTRGVVRDFVDVSQGLYRTESGLAANAP